jgi:hypothetical protein
MSRQVETLERQGELAANFVRKAALMIARAPTERRPHAYALIERRFNEVFIEILGDSEAARRKLRQQVTSIRALVSEMDARECSGNG